MILDPPPASPARDLWRWRFANASLDESTLELHVAGEPVDIEPKPLEFLMCLLRHAGEVVTKDELLEALWAGRVVTESVLTTCVGKLRMALGDEAHQIIRTVHGYGYRLTAEISRDSLAGRLPFQASKLAAGNAPPGRPDGGSSPRMTARKAKRGSPSTRRRARSGFSSSPTTRSSSRA